MPRGTMWETLELRELRVFLTLAEELHFARTAERLSLTPSRVSQMIRTLEARVGAKLFARTSRRVKLTTLGEELQRQALPTVTASAGPVIHVSSSAVASSA
jgi:DNA-binding transcriptional LysR family regulator